MGNRLIKFILASLTICSCYAEPNQILHNQSELEELSLPGEKFKLTAAMQGSETIGRLQAFISIDGNLTEYYSLPGVLNQQELMVYTFEIPSPEKSLSYQFFANLGENKFLSSQRYNFQRSCLPDLVIPDTIPEDASERVVYAIKKAKQLEHDIKMYDQSLVLIEQITKELAK